MCFGNRDLSYGLSAVRGMRGGCAAVNVILRRREDHCRYNQKRKRSRGITVALNSITGVRMNSSADTDTWSEDCPNKDGWRQKVR